MDQSLSLATMKSAFSSKAYKSLDAEERHKRALAAAQDFESVYIADAFKDMFKDVPVDPLTGENDNANSTWRDMLIDQYSKSLVKRGGIGIAEPIARDLLAIQEGAH